MADVFGVETTALSQTSGRGSDYIYCREGLFGYGQKSSHLGRVKVKICPRVLRFLMQGEKGLMWV